MLASQIRRFGHCLHDYQRALFSPLPFGNGASSGVLRSALLQYTLAGSSCLPSRELLNFRDSALFG